METSEEIISTKITGNTTEQLVKKVFYEERDGKMCRITQTINRTTTRTYGPPSRDIKPFGAALNSNNASYTSIGAEVFFEKPPAATPASMLAPVRAPVVVPTSAPVARLPPRRTEQAPAYSGSRFVQEPPEGEHIRLGQMKKLPGLGPPARRFESSAPAPVPSSAAFVPAKKTFASLMSKSTPSSHSSVSEDEEYKRTVFMENIPDDADRNDITDFVCEAAGIDRVVVKRVNVVYDSSGHSRGKAFAVFTNAKIAAHVIERIDGMVFGQHCIIHAQLAKPRGS